MRKVIIGLLLATAVPAVVSAKTVAVEEQSIDQLQAAMTSDKASSVDLVRAYLARIAAMDRKGPTLRAVIALNPDALAQAKALDAERKAGRIRGPLHGVPVLIKDNVETADAMPTTAGSLALKDNLTRRDAPVVAQLRAAGAVILGKTNLSEW
ncbi:MAG: amidase, partial [Sphingomonas sp.]